MTINSIPVSASALMGSSNVAMLNCSIVCWPLSALQSCLCHKCMTAKCTGLYDNHNTEHTEKVTGISDHFFSPKGELISILHNIIITVKDDQSLLNKVKYHAQNKSCNLRQRFFLYLDRNTPALHLTYFLFASVCVCAFPSQAIPGHDGRLILMLILMTLMQGHSGLAKAKK